MIGPSGSFGAICSHFVTVAPVHGDVSFCVCVCVVKPKASVVMQLFRCKYLVNVEAYIWDKMSVNVLVH